jgi:hypothetical protein
LTIHITMSSIFSSAQLDHELHLQFSSTRPWAPSSAQLDHELHLQLSSTRPWAPSSAQLNSTMSFIFSSAQPPLGIPRIMYEHSDVSYVCVSFTWYARTSDVSCTCINSMCPVQTSSFSVIAYWVLTPRSKRMPVRSRNVGL